MATDISKIILNDETLNLKDATSRTNISTINTTLSTHTTNISNLTTEQNTHKTKIATLEGKVQTLEQADNYVISVDEATETLKFEK